MQLSDNGTGGVDRGGSIVVRYGAAQPKGADAHSA